MPLTHRALPAGLLLAGILLVAANLRPVITAVGPVLPLIGTDMGLSASALGLLAAVPVMAFAVVSPVVHRLGRLLGVERAVLLALVVLGLGTLLRSLLGVPGVWLGTAVIGAAVAVGNVLLPVVVKRDFPLRVPMLTGLYISSQSLFAALASGLAVPLATMGSWRLAVGAWVVLVVAGVLLWLPRVLRPPRRAVPPAGQGAGSASAPAGVVAAGDIVRVRTVWTSAPAWQVAVYLGLQSTVFYTMINWLPTAEQDLGVDAVTAGWHHSLFQAVSIVGSLTAPALMRLGGDQRVAAAATPGLMLIAMLGMTAAPAWILLWVVLIGLSTGGAFTTALSLVGLRSADAGTASRLSSMAQGMGYLIAAAGLVGAGWLRDLTGPGPQLLLCVAGIAATQLLTGLLVGRNRQLLA